MRRWLARTTVALLLALAGCGSDDDSSLGDDSAGARFRACGGNPVGIWKVVALEFDDASALIRQTFQDEPACKDAEGDARVSPEGTYVFGSDKSFKFVVAFTVDMDVKLNQDCLQALTLALRVNDSACGMLEPVLEDQLGLMAASCAATTRACACSLSTSEVSASSETTYAVKGNQLFITTSSGDMRPSAFCVTGNRLEVKVISDVLPGMVAGLVVLER